MICKGSKGLYRALNSCFTMDLSAAAVKLIASTKTWALSSARTTFEAVGPGGVFCSPSVSKMIRSPPWVVPAGEVGEDQVFLKSIKSKAIISVQRVRNRVWTQTNNFFSTTPHWKMIKVNFFRHYKLLHKLQKWLEHMPNHTLLTRGNSPLVTDCRFGPCC